MSTQISKRTYRKRQRAEAEEETRRRIARATMELHEEVGPARTTVSAIADRAGVQRGTVYRHFPDEEALVDACSNLWLSLNAPPDLAPLTAIADPDERLRVALTEVYGWYERTAPTVEKLYRDATRVPAIAKRIQAREEVFDAVADLLMTGRPERGARRRRVRAAIGHALAFDTWRSLVRAQGLSRKQAVELMAALVAAA
jgi:AcrR family transcriptional regulator